MLVAASLVSSVLLASAVLAIPSHNHMTRALHRRAGVPSQIHHRHETVTSSGSDIGYDLNWAGAIQDVDVGTFTSVVGTLTVPYVWGDSGDAGCVWVGIDGSGCGQGLLQTGIDFTISNDGQVEYYAWYEWYPDYSYSFDTPVDISPGDTLKLTVNAFSNTSGLAMVENLTNGQTGSKYLNSTYALCQKSAEWIVEDYQLDDGSFVPFANFSAVTFREAQAVGASKTYTPFGSTIVDIAQNDQIMTSVSTSDSTVTILRS